MRAQILQWSWSASVETCSGMTPMAKKSISPSNSAAAVFTMSAFGSRNVISVPSNRYRVCSSRKSKYNSCAISIAICLPGTAGVLAGTEVLESANGVNIEYFGQKQDIQPKAGEDAGENMTERASQCKNQVVAFPKLTMTTLEALHEAYRNGCP